MIYLYKCERIQIPLSTGSFHYCPLTSREKINQDSSKCEDGKVVLNQIVKPNWSYTEPTSLWRTSRALFPKSWNGGP